jgi:hypothetical protein
MGLFKVLLRYRLLICFTGFVLLLVPLVPVGVSYPYYLIRLDYLSLASLILVTAAVASELVVFGGVSVASTLLLEFLGLLVMWLARLYAVLYTFFLNPYDFYVGGFMLVPQQALITYLASLAGSALSFGAVLLHSLTQGPLVLAQTASFTDVWGTLSRAANSFLEHPAAVGFLLGFTTRLTPEVIWGGRLVGYDTVSYVAHLRDFTYRPSLFGSYWWMGGLRNTPPLLDWVLYPLALLADPALLFKVYPPVAYGALTALVALYCVKVLGLSGGRSVIASLVADFSLLSLRMSWDLQKQVLAQILVLASIILIERLRGDPIGLVKASPLLLLAGLASEFGAALALMISLLVVLLYVPRLGRFRALVSAVYVGIAVASYALISWYLRVPAVQNPVLGYAPPIVGEALTERPSTYPYVLICLGGLAPLYLAAVERLWGRVPLSVAFSLLLLAIGLAPLLLPWSSLSGAEWDRVLMSASHIVVALSTSQLWVLRGRAVKAAYILFLVTPGVFMVGPEGVNDLNSVLASALKRFPSGLAPAAPDPSIYDAAVRIALKASEAGKPIVTNPWMERFIHLHIRDPKPGEVIVVPWTSPQHVLCSMILNNLSRVVTVVIGHTYNASAKIELPEDFCLTGGGPTPANTTVLIAELEAETLAEEDIFRLVEVSIKNLTPSPP